MQLFQCFLLGLTTAGLGTAAGIRARLSNVINLAPSRTPATLIIPDVLNASTALNASSVADMSTALDISTALNGSNPSRRPLNELVTEAYLSTMDMYQGAILLEVQATATSRPGSTPTSLKDVRLIFSWGSSTTIYREMRQWGVWGPPRVVDTIPPQNNGPLPIEIGMDIVEASRLLRQAGFTDKYDAVDVRIPTDIPPELRQIYYIFAMVGQGPSFVAVRVSDGSVKPIASLSVGDGWLSGNASSTT